MKKFAVATALLLGLGATAQAATITASIVPNGGSTPFTLVNFGSGGVAGNTGAVGPISPAGAGFTVNFAGTSGVYVGDVSGVTRSPFRTVAGVATNRHYLNRRAGAANTMTLVFNSPQTAFNLLWGSVDAGTDYNKLTFDFGGQTVNGSQVAAAVGGLTFGTSNVAVQITGLNAFTTLIVSANQEAFEWNPGVAVNVPDGGATLALLGCALMGLGVLRRKFSA